MCVIVVAFSVKAADTQPPAAVLVPADGFYISGLHGDYGGSDLAHHIVAQMLALIAVGTGDAEVIIVLIGKSLGNGREGL